MTVLLVAKILQDVVPEKGEAGSNRLVVLVHGWCGKWRSFSIEDVAQTIREQMPDADLLVPKYPSGPTSNANPLDISEKLADAIQWACAERGKQPGEYGEIILVGFSLGSLLVRKAFIIGRQESVTLTYGVPRGRYTWVERVSRIILLAGCNRGWSMCPKPKQASALLYVMYRLLCPLQKVIPLGRLIRAYERGSPFVENLRIEWNRLEQRHVIPLTVQLYGKEEDVVSREDMVDMTFCKNFVFLEVPWTGHFNAGNFHQRRVGGTRRERFVHALKDNIEDLRHDSAAPADSEREADVNYCGDSQAPVTHAVFIVHGIRDFGHWTGFVRDCLCRIAGEHRIRISVNISTYPRFPMLGFLLGNRRREKVQWFVDQYSRTLARHPEARFHFIGHSNGTYLLASALERYEAIRFHRVAFAGSVVRRGYPWRRVFEQGRIESLRNDVAVGDWIVAVFPRFFEQVAQITRLHLGDIGSGGVFGFNDTEARHHQKMIHGRHGAAIHRDNHASLARYVLGIDKEPQLDESDNIRPADRLPATTRWLSVFSWVIWLFLLSCPALSAAALIYAVYGVSSSSWQLTGLLPWLSTLSFPWWQILIPVLVVALLIWWLLNTV